MTSLILLLNVPYLIKNLLGFLMIIRFIEVYHYRVFWLVVHLVVRLWLWKLLLIGSSSVSNSIHISGYVKIKVTVGFLLRIFLTSRSTESFSLKPNALVKVFGNDGQKWNWEFGFLFSSSNSTISLRKLYDYYFDLYLVFITYNGDSVQVVIFVALYFNLVYIAVVDHGQKCKSSESYFEFILMVTLSHYVRLFHIIEFGSVLQGTFDKIEKFWKY